MSRSPCRCLGPSFDKFVHCAVLVALADGPLHGYRLVERLAGMPTFQGCAPDPTGVYRVLREMEDLGLVLGSWETPERGPAKRSYAITVDGLACLGNWAASLERYQGMVAGLVRLAKRGATP